MTDPVYLECRHAAGGGHTLLIALTVFGPKVWPEGRAIRIERADALRLLASREASSETAPDQRHAREVGRYAWRIEER